MLRLYIIVCYRAAKIILNKHKYRVKHLQSNDARPTLRLFKPDLYCQVQPFEAGVFRVNWPKEIL